MVMPSLLLAPQTKKEKKLDYTDLECLEEAGCRCRLSVPRALQGRPISPRYSSATALELGNLGPDHSIAEPSKLTQQGGRGCLDLPRKTTIKYAHQVPGMLERSLPSPLFPYHPPSSSVLLLQKCSPCSPSRTRLLLPVPPTTHRSRGTKSARGSHASGAVPEGYCR
jgi:hypothetical protein